MIEKYCEYLDPYFDEIFKPVYDFNAQFAKVIGLPELSSIYLLVLFFPLLLSIIYRFIPRTWYIVKHLFNSFFGLFMCGLLFKSGMTVPVLSVLLGYLLYVFIPPKWNRFVTPFLMFTILSLCNIREMIYHYMEWRATFLIVQMLLTFKISSVAVNLNDGEKMKKDEDSVMEELKEFALQKRPSLLQYFSFNFHYGTISTGPVYEYTHFINWIENERPFPLDIMAILHRIFFALLFLTIFVVSDVNSINADDFCDPEFLASHSAIYLLIYSSVVLFCMRAKYLFAWFFAEAICITAGFGYSGTDSSGSSKWENIQQTDMILLYTATSIRNALNSWNMATSRWLRRYVYYRAPFGARTARNLSAMTVSAFWHGFYPGYYFSWPVLAVLVQIYIQMYQKVRPKVKKWLGWDETTKTPIWLTLFLMFLLRTFGNHVVMPFHLYSKECSMRFFNRFHWVLHIIIVVVFVWLVFFVKRVKRKKKE